MLDRPVARRLAEAFAFDRSELRLVHLGLVLAVYGLTLACLPFRATAEAFESPSFIQGSMASGQVGKRHLLLILLSVAAAVASFLPRLRDRSWGFTGGARVLHGTVLVTVAYMYAAYPANWHLGQFHLGERLLVVALAAASCFRPQLSGPLLLVTVMSAAQWDLPLPVNGETTNQSIFVDMQATFFALAIVHPVVKLSSALQLGIPTGMILVHYWVAGWDKMKISPRFYEWVTNNDLGNLIVTGYTNGWNVLWTLDSVADVAGVVSFLSPLLLAFVLLIEITAPLSLASYRVFLVCTALRVILHLGIFIAVGDIFWNWVALGIGLGVSAVVAKRTSSAGRLFSPKAAVLCMALAVVGYQHTKARSLGWFDCPIGHDFDYIVVGESGSRYELADAYAEPHDLALVQNVFQYTVDTPTVTYCYGSARDYRVYSLLTATDTVAGVQQILEEYGTNRLDAGASAHIDAFFRSLLSEETLAMKSSPLARWISAIAPPHHIWTYPSGELPEWRNQEKPRAVELVYKRHFFTDGKIEWLDHRVVRTIAFGTS